MSRIYKLLSNIIICLLIANYILSNLMIYLLIFKCISIEQDITCSSVVYIIKLCKLLYEIVDYITYKLHFYLNTKLTVIYRLY